MYTLKLKSIIPVLLLLMIGLTSCDKNDRTYKESLPDLDRLLQGNRRFRLGHPEHPDETLERIKQIKDGQKPFVVVVSCSDSRVPPELIFDQGFGDVFTIRTAGNVIGDYELGSIEYAIEHLNTGLVLVMGHQKCGAIDAFIKSAGVKQNNHIDNIIDYIKVEEELGSIKDDLKSDVELVTKANVLHGVNLISSFPAMKEKIAAKKLNVVGALYHLDDGDVEIVKDLSKKEK